jgi:hypothetical protein
VRIVQEAQFGGMLLVGQQVPSRRGEDTAFTSYRY